MADEADIASNFIDDEVSNALRKIRQQASRAQGSKFCVECEEEIPEGRQQLGFKLCVPCAQDAERRKAMFVDD